MSLRKYIDYEGLKHYHSLAQKEKELIEEKIEEIEVGAKLGVTSILDYSKQYLTIVSLEDNNSISFTRLSANLKISVSTDNGLTWVEKANADLATLNKGENLLIKGTNPAYGSPLAYTYSYFSATKQFNVQGNILSLIFGDNFIGQTTLPEYFTFFSLFKDCIKLISAKNLVLSATVLKANCYYLMFLGCTSLIYSPKLPALKLVGDCYDAMFRGCTSLITAPELPATTLADGCYASMFEGCTKLINVSDLLVVTVAVRCYLNMFRNCTSLTTAPIIVAKQLIGNTYTECCRSMFEGCSKLNFVKCLATNNNSGQYTPSWTNTVSESGVFIKANDAIWPTGVNGIPTNWTVYTESEYEVVRQKELTTHTSDTSNPHNVTKSLVGLSNVTNDAQVKRSEMGVANGVATLDESGKVSTAQLPSYVDDLDTKILNLLTSFLLLDTAIGNIETLLAAI